MATHSSILAKKIPWTDEPVGLLSMGVTESNMIEVTWHACHHRAVSWDPSAMQQLPTSIYFTHGSVYTSMLLSQFVLPLTFNTWMGGQFGGESIHVYVWSSPFIVPLKLPQNCLLLWYVFVHSLNRVCLQPHEFSMPVSLSFSITLSLFKLMSIESVMPSNHLILCNHLLVNFWCFSASGSFLMSQLFISVGQKY